MVNEFEDVARDDGIEDYSEEQKCGEEASIVSYTVLRSLHLEHQEHASIVKKDS